MAMATFRPRSALVEARRLTNSNYSELMKWINGGDTLDNGRTAYHASGEINITIRTGDGEARADVGDWIVMDGKGKFNVFNHSLFRSLYEPEV